MSSTIDTNILAKYKRIAGLFVDAGTSLPKFLMLQLSKLEEPVFKDFLRHLLMADKSAPKMYAYSIQYLFASMEWLPSFKEFILFATFIAIIYIIVEILHNSYVNNKVQQKSRCVLAKSSQQNTVTATDGQGNQLYTVTYNPATKEAAQVTCVGSGSGDKTNVYTVNVYDYNNKVTNQVPQTCTQQPFTASGGTPQTTGASVFYSGDPGLVDFMTTSNPSYFA